jgi:hypothetical protein
MRRWASTIGAVNPKWAFPRIGAVKAFRWTPPRSYGYTPRRVRGSVAGSRTNLNDATEDVMLTKQVAAGASVLALLKIHGR